MSAEDQRKTANLIKQGNIAESDPAGRVRVRIDCPQSSFTGALTVGGLLTYQAGMAGSNGRGGSTTINGNIRHSGGTLSSNGVVLDAHTHKGVTPGGGNTGEPVK